MCFIESAGITNYNVVFSSSFHSTSAFHFVTWVSFCNPVRILISAACCPNACVHRHLCPSLSGEGGETDCTHVGAGVYTACAYLFQKVMSPRLADGLLRGSAVACQGTHGLLCLRAFCLE